MPPRPTPNGKMSWFRIHCHASGQVREMRIAKEAKLNTPPLCGISSPRVNSGRATAARAKAMQAVQSSRIAAPYRHAQNDG